MRDDTAIKMLEAFFFFNLKKQKQNHQDRKAVCFDALLYSIPKETGLKAPSKCFPFI